MAHPIRGQDYPFWNNAVLDQEYPRWNNLFDTMNFDDVVSLRRIFHAISVAETFHPFNLNFIQDATLSAMSDAEMIAVRDFSYAFNRNHLCRDMILHLILFSRHDDPSFPLGKETKFYTEMLKTTHVSPVREPSTYLQLRREFRRLAPDLEDLDENKAVDEIRRWARLQAHGMLNNMTFEENGTLSSKEESGKEDVNAEVLEAAATLMSMSKQA